MVLKVIRFLFSQCTKLSTHFFFYNSVKCTSFVLFYALLVTVQARPRAGILLALPCQTARMFQIAHTCHIVTTACLGLGGVSK